MSKPLVFRLAFAITFILVVLPMAMIGRLFRIGQQNIEGDDSSEESKNSNEAICLKLETEGLSSTGLFAVQIGQLASHKIVSLRSKAELLAAMEKQWGFDFGNKETARERALYGMKYLWSQGLVDELIKKSKYVEGISVKDAVAYDSVQFSSFIHQIKKLELIESQEAWGMLFINAQRVQDCYSSWDDFGNAYINGYVLNEVLTGEDDIHQSNEIKKTLNENLIFSEQYQQLIKVK